MRATICVDRENSAEVAAVDSWFAKWRSQLVFVSDNQGCGCCVDIWNVEGASEAVKEIPENARSSSEWADGKR
jgi:hypothetical protein